MVYSEFQPLKECIVGTSYKKVNINGLDQVIEETNEDLDNLASLLEKSGVIVHRPKQPEFSLDIHHPVNPRDVFGFFGNKMFLTYGAIVARMKELDCYEEIAKHYEQNYAYQLYRMPKPPLEKTETFEYTRSFKKYLQSFDGKISIQERYDKYKDIILCDTANFIKCGTTILHSQSALKSPKTGKGTEIGLEWVKSLMPEYNFIEIPVGGHIDGKIALLRPGLLMTWHEDFIPPELANWDKIIIEDNKTFPKEFLVTKKKRFYKEYVEKYLSDWVGNPQETWFDVNCFSINENTIISTGSDMKSIRKLNQAGIEVIKWNLRHRYFWDFGAHCCTQDTVREGGLENYFSS